MSKTRRDEAAASGAGRGGDVIFAAGRGGVDPMGLRAADGDVIFRFSDGAEAMRLCGDGRVLVRGNEVARDEEVYLGLRAWLAAANVSLEPGAYSRPDPVCPTCHGEGYVKGPSADGVERFFRCPSCRGG